MHPEFNIFGLTIPAWGTMVAIGVLALVGVMFYYFNKYKISDFNIDRLIMLTALSGLTMYLAASFFDSLWHNLDVWRETGVFKWEWWGVTFSGGLIGGLVVYFVGYWFLFKKERYHIFYYLDIIITGVVITHAFGRIGCFLAGCCYGKETTSWLGMVYPTDNGMLKVYPTQLFEAGFLVILFLILFFVVKKNQLRYYLVSYGVFRFILEYFRGDSRGATVFGILSPSQFLSVFMVIAGILLFIFGDKIVYLLKKKYNPELLIEQIPEESPTENAESEKEL